jgi:hypothetical protein
MNDTHVDPGQVVRIDFDPPEQYGWGIPSQLHAASERTLTWITTLLGRLQDEELTTAWEGGGYEDIGWRGPASWRWVVPRRLEPGIYSIAKNGITSGRRPVQDRTKWWVVSFEVTE